MSGFDNKYRLEALLNAQVQTHLICSNGASAITNVYPAAGIALAANTGTDPTAVALPSGASWLDFIEGRLDAIAGGATSITWYISQAADGGYPITDAITTVILPEPATPTEGGVAARIDLPFRRFYIAGPVAIGVVGTLYVFARTNAGTCNMTTRLTYRATVPYPRDQYLPTL